MKPTGGFLLAIVLAVSAMAPGQAAVQLPIEEELAKLERGEVPDRVIAGARYRIAVFSFEDPDGTGLGDTLAALISRQVLTRTRVPSLGVLRYEGTLGPSAPGELGYFEKVDRLSRSQRPVLSVWGMIRRSADRIVIDTYAQLPAEVIDSAFSWRLVLPRPMNGGTLVARLGPDRFQVQRFEMPAAESAQLLAAGAALDVIREEPVQDAPAMGSLPQRKVYRVLERADRWIKVAVQDGPVGWIPESGSCGEACEAVTASGNFLSDLVGAMEDLRQPRADGLARDARVLSSELLAIEALNDGSIEAIEEGSLPALEQWFEPSADRATQATPGGAAVANLRAVSRMALALRMAARDHPGGHDTAADLFNELELDQGVVESIADDLARASLDDPRNAEVLDNLAVLFQYAGDARRAALARSLAAQQTTPPAD